MLNNRVLLYSVFLFLLLGLYSCGSPNRSIPESKRPKVNLKIQRYGKALFQIDTNNFKQDIGKLKKQFPYFLDADLSNKQNYKQLYDFVSDTSIIHVYQKTMQVFPDVRPLERSLSKEFSYIKYYFPQYKLPQVFTYVSDLYYEQPVMIKDSVLVIALDDYLGENYPPYIELDIPFYHRRLMKPEFIPVDVAKKLYQHSFRNPVPLKTLLDHMIEAGKMLYFLDAVLPETNDTLKIGYTESQMKWIEQNKKEVWSVMINNQMLFSGDYKVISNMMHPGPFTDGFSRTSPPYMGAWFGWQIVRRYMDKHPQTSLAQLFKMEDSQQLLHQSGYKP